MSQICFLDYTPEMGRLSIQDISPGPKDVHIIRGIPLYSNLDRMPTKHFGHLNDMLASLKLQLQQSYEHAILYTFNGDAIFFQGHPYIWSTGYTALHDTKGIH